MLDAFLLGLSTLTPTVLLWLVVGVLVSTVIVIIPGLGGVFAMVLLFPLAYSLTPEAGLAMLVAAAAVSGTGNTITGVLFGVPGSATGVATILDGYPMAKKGLATRALTAGLTASAVGGVFGAIILALILPFMRPLVLSLGSPEFFMMIFAALVFMSYVGEGSKLKSLTAGFAGLMLSFVGLEISTATARYTFGTLYLIDGVRLVPLFIGLFAVAEMLILLRKGGTIAAQEAKYGTRTQIADGFLDVFRHWRTTVISSTVGVVVGPEEGNDEDGRRERRRGDSRDLRESPCERDAERRAEHVRDDQDEDEHPDEVEVLGEHRLARPDAETDHRCEEQRHR